jgi:hypothetical protein
VPDPMRLVDVGEDEGGEESVTLFERGEKTLASVTRNHIENDVENIPCHKIGPVLDQCFELVGTASERLRREEFSTSRWLRAEIEMFGRVVWTSMAAAASLL